MTRWPPPPPPSPAVPDYSALRPITTWKHKPFPAFEAHPNAICFGYYEQPSRDPLRAIVSVDLPPDHPDGHWLHLSISRARRLPTWGDLCTARDQLGYRERLFVQMVPPASAWLNMHSYCLHLICRLDGETIPAVMWQQGGDGSRYGKRGSIV